MAKGKKTKPPSVRLAENVALLFALDQVQEAAGSNPIPKERLENGLRTLTFDQETEICTALAFLAGVSDDPCDVMAVAVEEHNRPTSIHVKIAINKSKPGDGHETVERVTAGFNGIFKILSRVSKGDTLASAPEVFREVIRFSRDRILKRLRSKKVKAHFRKKHKKPLMALLHSFGVAAKSHSCGEMTMRFAKHAARITRRMEAVEIAEPGLDEEYLLGRLLQSIKRFMDVVNLDLLTTQIKTRLKTFDIGIAIALKEKFSKLSHYEKVTTCLFKFAKKTEVFQQFEIKSVCHPPKLMPVAGVQAKIDLGALLESLDVDVTSRAPLMEEIRLQGNGGPMPDPIGYFMKTACDALTSGKVHAEVQLLCHYETVKLDLPPRVIVSTKSACFLCNTLFQIHNKYYIPSAHGRLYAGWLLPANIDTVTQPLLERLTTTVGEKNKRIIHELMSKAQRNRLYSGNESVIFKISSSLFSAAASVASTVATTVRPTVKTPSMTRTESSSATTIRPFLTDTNDEEIVCALESSEDDITPSLNRVTESVIPTVKPETFRTCKGGTMGMEHNQESYPETQVTFNDSQPPNSTGSRQPRSDPRVIKPILLSRGKRHVISVAHEEIAPCVSTDFLDLFLDFSSQATTSTERIALPWTIEVEWVSVAQMTDSDLKEAQDAHCLPTGKEIACSQRDELLLIRAGDEIIKVRRKRD